MIKRAFIAALALAAGTLSAHAADITIRGLTVSVPTENPVAAGFYKEGLDALFESCPAIMSYRQDIDHYGIYANIDVHPWNIDSKSFNYFHYKGRAKSGKSNLEQIAERFGWHGGLWITITTINDPQSKTLKTAPNAFNGKPGGPRQIQFQVGGGKHPGIVMKPDAKQFCQPAHSLEVKMPEARKDWGDPATLIYVPDDNAFYVESLF